MYECKKQVVVADLYLRSGAIYSATNHILAKDIKICPRVVGNFESGKGYHLCKEVCNQPAHAEVNVINESLKKEHLLDLKDSTLVLKNHEYICDNCLKELIRINVRNVVITNLFFEKEYILHNGILNEMSGKMTYGLRVGDNVYLDLEKGNNEDEVYLNKRVGVITDIHYPKATDSNQSILVGVKYKNSFIDYAQHKIERLKNDSHIINMTNNKIINTLMEK